MAFTKRIEMPGTGPEAFAYGEDAKKEGPKGQEKEFAASELLEALDEGQEAAPVQQKQPSLTERAISLVYEELGEAKNPRPRAEDGTELMVFPEERVALALAARDRAKRLVEKLKMFGAEEGSAQEQMDLERAEVAVSDAEALAEVGARIWGATENSPKVQEKLAEIQAKAQERWEAEGKEDERVLAEKRARPMAEQAVSGAHLKSLSEQGPTPFGAEEVTKAGVAPGVEVVRDIDIVGVADTGLNEEEQALSREIAAAQVELQALAENADIPDREQRLDGLLRRAEALSMRATREGQREAQEGVPHMENVRDIDMLATQLVLRTRGQLDSLKGEEVTQSEVLREVADAQVAPLEPSGAARTVVEEQAAVPTPVEDIFATQEEAATQSEQTVVTPAPRAASVGPDDPTRIRIPAPERTVASEPPTMDEGTQAA